MMNLKNTARTIWQELFNALLSIRHGPTELNNEEKNILSVIKKEGFYIIPNFYSKTECDEIRNEIDILLEKYKNQVAIDDTASDHRILGADRISSLILKFFEHPFIRKIIYAHEQTKNIVGFTLAAKLEYKTSNLGSGGGWHRDRTTGKQIKALLYLTDVDVNNGPFQYLKRSHRPLNIIKECASENFEFNQSRFDNKQIEKLINKKYKEKLLTLTGKAGTIVFVNTRGIHRGMPIEKGVRYSLTNYYWSNMPIPKHVKELMVKKLDQ